MNIPTKMTSNTGKNTASRTRENEKKERDPDLRKKTVCFENLEFSWNQNAYLYFGILVNN